ncbi:MAG: hypothetical protein HXX80_00145, partial [Nitrososphaerales archaeon]|nr:hypothetical protein [Nitrososphaerales archaeon]
DRALVNNPSVYIKSHPKGREKRVSRIEVQVTMIADDRSTARKKVEDALELLISMIKEHGGMLDREAKE